MSSLNKKSIEQIILGILMITILGLSLFIKENIYIKYILILPFIVESVIISTRKIKEFNINTIVIISIISSLVYSIYLDIYYKECINIFLFIISFVIFVLKLKELIEYITISKIENEEKYLKTKKYIKLKVKDKDTYKEVFYEDIKDKDIIICSSEEVAYFDGIVVKGATHFNESLINGNSNPVEKNVNSKIYKGSINYENEIEYEINISKENKYEKIEKDFDKDIDKISKKYLYFIIAFEILNIIISLILKNNSIEILNKFIITLIIPTICGIIIYNYPEIKEIKRYLKKGILIREKNIFEEINKIDTVVFDKTGILTNGYLGISKVYNHSDLKTNELLELLGSIEKHSTHALGIGITKHLKKEGITSKIDLITEDLNSFDVKAKDEKNIYYACTSKLLKKLDIINSYEKEEEELTIEGNYVLYIVKNNKVLALVALKDIIKNETKRLLKYLKEKKLDIVVLSGDNEVVTKKITDELEIEKVYSGLNTNDKKKIIDELRKNNKHVLMIGDGDNDSKALKSSNIAVTIKDSTILAKESSDIIIKNSNITKVIEIIDSGKKVLNKIRENIIISILLFIILELINIFNFPKICICILIIAVCIISYMLIIINTIRQ